VNDRLKRRDGDLPGLAGSSDDARLQVGDHGVNLFGI
jgi:hypothetical protein